MFKSENWNVDIKQNAQKKYKSYSRGIASNIPDGERGPVDLGYDPGPREAAILRRQPVKKESEPLQMR